jgi:hypothetical protein
MAEDDMLPNMALKVDGVQTGARASFLKRTMGALQRMSAEMTDEMLLAALAAPSDLGTLARAIGDSRLVDPAMQIDPLAPAVARSLEHRKVLLGLAGPMMSSTQVADLLGLSRQAVDKRRAASRLLALRIGSDWQYPAFQFEDGVVLPDLERVILSQEGADAWVVLDILLAQDSAIGDRSLLDALRRHDSQAIARALSQTAGDGFA